MKQNYHLIFCATALLGLMGVSTQSYGYDDAGYTGLNSAQRSEWRRYQEYEVREPCQNYRPAPLDLIRDGCDLVHPAPFIVAQPPVRAGNVLSSYEINFGFNLTFIEADAVLVLDRVAREIRTYRPSEVTISGFTDRAGRSDYNMDLSKRRAQAVSTALTQRGVPNRVTSEIAYGENYLAVETRDGARLRENRRVVIEFRK
jgi:OmpA-OmpF porin, OOP family